RELSTTMAYGRMLAQLLRDPEIGRFIVPIVPDEARTFGMEALFFQVGIYSHIGQLYEPVDRSSMLYYREATDGQILEEGITEAGPTCLAYDPAFAYELAVVVQDGIRRMYQEGEDIFYYITLYNENYAMPPMPEGAAEGILRGLYRFRDEPAGKRKPTVQLLG